MRTDMKKIDGKLRERARIPLGQFIDISVDLLKAKGIGKHARTRIIRSNV